MNIDKEMWIEKRAQQIQEAHQEKLRRAEEIGYPYYGSDECAWEEAEEEWNSLYGSDEEEEE